MVEIREAQVSHKRTGTDSSRTSSENLFTRQTEPADSFENRQLDCTDIPDKERRDQKHYPNPDIQKDMGVPLFEKNRTDSGLDPVGTECRSRHNVQTTSEFQRMETVTSHIQRHNSSLGHTDSGLFCVKGKQTTSPIYEPYAGSGLYGNERDEPEMDRRIPIPLPAFLPPGTDPGKDKERASKQSNSDCSALDNTTMVPFNLRAVHTNTPNVSMPKPYAVQPHGGNASISGVTMARGFPNIRGTSRTPELSERAATLLKESRREGTRNAYATPWRKWSSWCMSRNLDPHTAPVIEICNFLGTLFDAKWEYNTIGVYRSAISAYHQPIEGQDAGKHPTIIKLMAGIGNCRPPKPRYCVIWDVQQVLDWMSNLGDNEELSLKLLSFKTATLTALAAACRGNDLFLMDRKWIAETRDTLTFYFPKLRKTEKPNKRKPPLTLEKFEEDMKICPVSTMRSYLERTTPKIHESTTAVFVSHIRPFKGVTRATISTWVKEVLKSTGVDTSKFKSHSTRAASTSKAACRGATLQDILDRGCWSQSSTWQKFYNKNIKTPAGNFQKAGSP